MAKDKPLGLSPFDIDLMNLANGASYPMPYGELGFMLSSMWKRLPERLFRPRFLSACGRRLVGFISWEEMARDIRLRRVSEMPRGVEAIKDMGMLTARVTGNNEMWRYYAMRDQYNSSEKELDKFATGSKFSMAAKRKPTAAQLASKKWRQKQGLEITPEEVKNRKLLRYI